MRDLIDDLLDDFPTKENISREAIAEAIGSARQAYLDGLRLEEFDRNRKERIERSKQLAAYLKEAERLMRALNKLELTDPLDPCSQTRLWGNEESTLPDLYATHTTTQWIWRPVQHAHETDIVLEGHDETYTQPYPVYGPVNNMRQYREKAENDAKFIGKSLGHRPRLHGLRCFYIECAKLWERLYPGDLIGQADQTRFYRWADTILVNIDPDFRPASANWRENMARELNTQ